jgi:hypothetical protein
MVRAGGAAMPFEEAVQKTYMARVSLSATGFYKTPKIDWDRIAGRGRPFFYFAYGAACSEVVIDTLTGENRILRTDILHDCGASLNPALDIGQIEGGFVQGAGWLTMEELVWDARHAQDPCALDLQDPGLFGPAARLQRGALGRGRTGRTRSIAPRRWGNRPDAGDQRAFGAGAGLCRLRAELSRTCRRPRRPRRSSRR